VTTYSYSTDEEHFSGDFETPEAAAEECFFNFSDVDSCFVGENQKFKAHDFIPVASFLENVQGNAGDVCGESAEDWLHAVSTNKAKKSELKMLIGDWLETHAPVTFFAVGDVVEYQRPPELDFGSEAE